MELADIQAALGPGEPAFRAQQIYRALYRQRVGDLAAISNLPKTLRARLADEFPLGLPEIAKRYDSADGTVRYLLQLSDGKTVETVWMPESKNRDADKAKSIDRDDESSELDWDRATICISSQVGCLPSIVSSA